MSESVYDEVGGSPFFEELVGRFYDDVAEDPLLRPLYPEQDLTGARARLCGFLIQYWGGPDDYSVERGHPRLRMRHAPFAIGTEQRNAWMRHMIAALEVAELSDERRSEMTAYFDNASSHLVNHVDTPARPADRKGLL
ncbi:MAG: globin [Acidobacteria bacterium]|nr:globin [Acidobacteriota bacterium]